MDDDFSEIEVICFDLIFAANRTRFFVIYRPPNSDSEAVTYMTTLVKCLLKYESNKYANVLVGDLNLPKVDWSSNTGPNHEVYQQFLRFTLESSYTQLTHFPTRDNNILDVILTTNPSMFISVKPDTPIGSSDHCSVVFEMVLSCRTICNLQPHVESSVRYR